MCAVHKAQFSENFNLPYDLDKTYKEKSWIYLTA